MGASARSWSIAVGVALLGALGILSAGLMGLGDDPAAPATVRPLGLAWLGIAAPTCGVLGAGAGRPLLLAPAIWLVLTLLLGAPLAGLVAVGLFGIGFGLGSRCEEARVALAGGLLLVSLTLTALPSAGGLAGHAPWSPGTTARLLDLSPAVLIVECAGIDWLRHPAVYGPAGGDAIGPDLRVPWSGPSAGILLVLVGGAISALLRRARPATPEP